MNKTIKAALITGIATIIAGFIGGMGYGKSSEQKNIQNEIQSVMGNVINVTGNDNQVTINSIKDLVDEYQRLQSQNQSLLEQNTKYFRDLTEANYQVNALQSKTNDLPEIKFNNLSLLIDVQDIPINKNNSMVTIDGRDYFSREIMESLIPDGQNFTIKDDTLFIGKVIADTANLFDQWISDQSAYCKMGKTIKDSYGNLYSDCLLLLCSDITFNTQGKYSFLKCDIAMSEKSSSGVLIIEADRNLVYSIELNKLSEPITEIKIPIKNCKLLRFSYNTNSAVSENGCIIANATLYNE